MRLTARNVLLFTLLVDDTTTKAADKIWNIYYHLYLDDDSLRLLDSQAVKLASLSVTLERWNTGQYGHALRFCDQRTFAKIKAVWTAYSSEQLDQEEKLNRRQRYQATIDKARAAKKQMMGESVSYSGVRSGSPIGIQALRDLPTIHDYFWAHGTVNLGEDTKNQPKHPNPTFTSSPNQALTLHYGLDPLLGFHLATAYAPLISQSPLFQENQSTSSVKAVVQAARRQFREWSKSFRQSIASGSVLRFFTGDAIAFCHTLQQAKADERGSNANLYCDSWTFQPLQLDTEDYGNTAQIAPLKFDIIDTSNLVDHLGALNVLVATAPLLADRVASTLYTEVLVQHESSVQAMVDSILCGHFGTVSLLLGLASVESWTNTTAVADVEEGMLDSVMESMKMKAAKGSTQLRTRLRWKKQSALSRPYLPLPDAICQPPSDLEIDAQGMSRLLHSMYQAMFRHEDIMTLMTSIQIQGVGKLSNPYYNRASFAALLKHVKSNVVVDWEKTIDLFLHVLQEEVSPISVSRNYLQELNLYLYLSGMHTVDVLRDGALKMFNLVAAKHLPSWDHVPSVLCITLEIPAANLKPLKDKSLATLGTPSLCCTLQSSRTSPQNGRTISQLCKLHLETSFL